MRQGWGKGLTPSALAALCAAALVALAVLSPRPWSLAVGAPGDAYFVANSFPPEGDRASPLRWTREATQLQLYGAYAGATALELRLYRDLAGGAGQDWPVSITASETTLAVFETAPGWRRYRLALPPGTTGGTLTLSSPTFQPGAGDPRQLGVALASLRALPLAGPAPWAAALERGAWLGAALLLVGATAWSLDQFARGPSAVGGRPGMIAALVGGLGAAAAAWAWLDPPSFAWALPSSWAGAALAAGGVGALWASLALTPHARAALPSPAPSPALRARGSAAWALVAALVVAHAALLLPLPAVWRELAALLILLMPGAIAAIAVAGEDADYAEHGFLAVAGGVAVAALLMLALHALPGPPPAWLVVLAADLLTLGSSWALWMQPGGPQRGGPQRGELTAAQPGGPQRDVAQRGEPTAAQPGGPQRDVAQGGEPAAAQPGGPQRGELAAAQPGGPQRDELAAAQAQASAHPSERKRALTPASAASAHPSERQRALTPASAASAHPSERQRALTPASASERSLLLPLALAAVVRLWALGRSELQGDEAYALMLAKGVVHGQQDILLVHMKGPVEALLPAGPLAVAGTIAELAARLPFALAGVALVLAVWSLAGRLIGGRRGALAGFVAAMGVAADGLLSAFGRIVQYQTVVLLLSAAALWLCWRFYAGDAARRYLPAAALCAAVAVLAHYDGIYVAPALAWLVLAGGRRRGWRPWEWAGALAAPLAIGLALTLSFYLPFALHEHFGRTLSHLATRSEGGAGAALRNNLPGYGAMLSLYATRYLAAAAGLGLLAGLCALLVRHLRPQATAWAMATLLALGSLGAALAPGLLAVGPDGSLAGLLVIPPLLALVVAPRLPAGLRALVIWLAGALAAHAFLLADPRTHFYTFHAAAWLLLGYGVASLAEAMPRLRPILAAAGAALLTICLTYTGLVFLRPWPEFERAFPATMLPFFALPTGEALPDDGLFAFPHRDGWKTAAALFQNGALRGAYDSNQELFTPGWYLRGQFKCARDPDYFLTANGARPLFIPADYSHFGTVLVDGVRALEIYSREPVAGPAQQFDARDYEAAFDATPVPNFPLRRLLSGVVPQQRVDAGWQAGFALRGFDLDRPMIGAGDPAFLTLYWRADAALPATLAPAVAVRDSAGQTVAQLPTFCGGIPAEVWHETYVNDTPFQIAAGSLPPGEYTLHVGVRDLASDAWLPLESGGELLELTRLSVR